MFSRDEKLMARYLAAASGDVDIVYLAIQKAYEKHKLSPSPALILNEIRTLKSKERQSNKDRTTDREQHTAMI